MKNTILIVTTLSIYLITLLTFCPLIDSTYYLLSIALIITTLVLASITLSKISKNLYIISSILIIAITAVSFYLMLDARTDILNAFPDNGTRPNGINIYEYQIENSQYAYLLKRLKFFGTIGIVTFFSGVFATLNALIARIIIAVKRKNKPAIQPVMQPVAQPIMQPIIQPVAPPIPVYTVVQQPPQQPKQQDEKVTVSNIKAYKELLDEGAITQEEYEAKKKEMLGL